VTKALDYAHDAAKAWIVGLDARPVAARATLSQLRNTFQHALPETGMKAEEVIRWLAENANDGMLGSAGGRFFAWVIGGGLESALAPTGSSQPGIRTPRSMPAAQQRR
jgi:hypothetical protein